VIATAGKLGGTVLAARWTGLSWRDSVALGSLTAMTGPLVSITLNWGRSRSAAPDGEGCPP
jgi:Kef-type K+ transport system membrane component KefB